MIGLSNREGKIEEQKNLFSKIYQKIFPIVIQLACENESVTKKLF